MLKRRRRSSISSASRRSSASSSSSVRSALRVTRNVATSSITIPEKSVWRWAMISSSAGMKRDSSTSNRRGKTVGTLTRAKRRSSLLGVGVGHHRADAQGELGDVRERVARVDGQRREDGEDALLVDLGHPLAVDGVEVVPADDGDALGGERRHQLVEVDGLLAGDELVGPLRDLGQLLRSRCARRRSAPRRRRPPGPSGRPRGPGRTRRGCVVVMAQNLARSSSGMPGSLGQLQHSIVEGQPAQLAVDEPVIHARP